MAAAQILMHTPLWVFGLLALLILLGVRQIGTRVTSVRAALLRPSLMVALSAAGMAGTFGLQGPAPLLWLAGLTLSLLWAHRLIALPAASGYQPESGTLTVPGSWLPLLLILALFATKYTVGVMLATHAHEVSEPRFASIVGLAYGLMSGIFANRAWRTWTFVRASRNKLLKPRGGPAASTNV